MKLQRVASDPDANFTSPRAGRYTAGEEEWVALQERRNFESSLSETLLCAAGWSSV